MKYTRAHTAITDWKRSCGKVMFTARNVVCVFTGFCHSVHRGGESQHALGRHPPGQTPPAQCMLGYTPPCPVHAGIHPPQWPLQWTVCNVLECILVSDVFACPQGGGATRGRSVQGAPFLGGFCPGSLFRCHIGRRYHERGVL